MKKETAGCPGFQFSGCAAGLKKNGEKDLGLLYSETPAAAAGVFTQNCVKAACVQHGMERIKLGTCQAVIVNSGNANCCTGGQGLQDNLSVIRLAARQLGIPEETVIAASTGVIGKPLPVEKIEAAVPALFDSLSASGLSGFAQAIMTTDTVPKIVTRSGAVGSVPYTITGVAKGSGMIRPDMATMLCFVCTDAKVDAGILQKMLAEGTDRSFNRITVDGDTSTNDMVLLLANGMSGAEIREPEQIENFQSRLDQVLTELARMVVKDGEGATKLVEISVDGADTDHNARCIADTIAHSNLVKTAIYGQDPNWGRITAAAGRSGAEVDQDLMDLFFGDAALVLQGKWQGREAEARAAEIMKKNEIKITLDLNLGSETDSFLFCDFSENYVKINADYRT